jgi:hypothetical protein
MANIKITDLPAATALGGTELFECVQSSTSVKAAASQIRDYINTQRAYGSFYSTADQTAALAATAYSASFNNSASYNSGVTVASSTNITFSAAGIYECSFSAQLDNTDGADHDVTFWYTINGIDVANSASRVTVPKAGDGGKTVFEFNFQEQLTASQYIQIKWAVENTAVKLDYTAASAPYPAIPSIFFIANRIA